MRLTKASVERLAVPAGKTELYAWDDTLTGFGVKLNSGGSRNYLVQYRAADRRTKRIIVGKVGALTLDEARKRARALLIDVQAGGDPHAKKAKPAPAVVTLGSVADAYLTHARSRLKPRSYEQVERHLRRDWRPLAEMPVNDVKRADVAAQLTTLAADGHRVMATRARAALSAMFTWAMGEGIADANPVAGTNKPADEKSRDRVLSEAEVQAILCACRTDAYGRIVRLLLLTGQRRDEIGSIDDGELDLAGALWTIPSLRTKNGRAHEVPLSGLALELLTTQPRVINRSLVFGEGAGGFSGWSKCKERLDRRIAASGFVMPPWRLHDLRRTAATLMADRLAVPPHVIEAILNHVSGHKSGVAGIYNRAAYRAEKRDALDRWATYVQALVAHPDS